MTTVEEMVRAVVTNAIVHHPRSLQKRIGPSEIGKPCDRWILRKLAGVDEPERGISWKPTIGTAMHALFEEWFNAANRGGGDIENTEWVTEWGVNVGQIGGVDITGHSDLFHVPTGTVVDFKFIGDKQLTKYRLHGPSEQYRIQAHLYAKGFTDDNGWGPARTVAIWFLPRESEFGKAYFWSEPYDPHVALDALGRANRLWTLLQIVGLDAALNTAPLCDDQWCAFCKQDLRDAQKAGRVSLFEERIPGPSAVSCVACGAPLPASAIQEGHTTHPTCPTSESPGRVLRPVSPATPQPVALAPIISIFDKTS